MVIVPARVSAAVGELAALVANAQPFMPAMKPPDASLHGHAYASRHGCSSTSAQCGLGGLQWHGAALAYGELLLPTDITLYVHLVQGHVYPCSAKRTASAENQDLGTFVVAPGTVYILYRPAKLSWVYNGSRKLMSLEHTGGFAKLSALW